MSKAEKFIQDYTRNCSNELIAVESRAGKEVVSYHDWLTPDQARRAVEIAKNEMAEKACDAYCKVCGHYAHTTPVHICRQACDYYKDFKQAMKDE
jgi:hypothetical protein